VDFIRQNGGNFAGCVKNIKAIEISESDEILIELYNPEANFASMLVFPIIKNGTPAEISVPNGTGQFICSEENIGYTSLVCEKNGSYHLGRPYVDKIKVNYMNTDIKVETSFLSGESDVIINPDIDGEGKISENYKIYKGKSNKFEFLGFNSGGNLFSDESARRAIFAACKKVSLAEEFGEVEAVSSTPINPAAYFYAFETEEAETGEVADILTRNGWKMNGTGVYEKEGKTLKFTIIVNEDDSVRVGIANFLSHWLLNYGIYADVEILSYSRYKERLTSGDYDAFMGGCTIGNAANFSFLIGTGGSANVFGYSGGVMDMRLTALASAEGENLSQEAKKFGKAMAESAPLVGIYFKTTEVVTKKNVVIPKISPTGVYVEAYTWFLV
jgi:peptide/nickel transport system substrate-binding protein